MGKKSIARYLNYYSKILSDCGIKQNRKLKEQYMNKKLLISQSIMWAAAILVVSIVDEKQFAISMLVILATVSLMNLRKGK
jgi:hypothetical protein